MKIPQPNRKGLVYSLSSISKYEYDNNYEWAIWSRGFNLAIIKVIAMFGGKKKMKLSFKCKDCVDVNVCADYKVKTSIKLHNIEKILNKWEEKMFLLKRDKSDPITFACLAQLNECAEELKELKKLLK